MLAVCMFLEYLVFYYSVQRKQIQSCSSPHIPPLGIGANCVQQGAIHNLFVSHFEGAKGGERGSKYSCHNMICTFAYSQIL